MTLRPVLGAYVLYTSSRPHLILASHPFLSLPENTRKRGSSVEICSVRWFRTHSRRRKAVRTSQDPIPFEWHGPGYGVACIALVANHPESSSE